MEEKAEPKIKVGIVTDGKPVLDPLENGLTLLKNQVIGKDFHWQKTQEAILPGKVVAIPRPSYDGVTVINTLPLEKYLEVVVGSEMNPSAPLEFLKTHAILSRSWAYGKILRCHPEGKEGKIDCDNTHIGWDDTADHTGFDVCADDHCQRYQGIMEIALEALDAIRSTAGQILRDSGGKPVDARFSKCCGGHSEHFSSCWQDCEPEGITACPDSWCDLSGMDKDKRQELLKAVLKDYDLSSTEDFMNWEERIDKRFIAERVRECFGINIGHCATVIKPLKTGISGRHFLINITGDEREAIIGKELHIRRVLSDSHLKSSNFFVEDEGDSFLLKGRGWGHGVGLCQIGAARMAMTHTCIEILDKYFPGVKVE